MKNVKINPYLVKKAFKPKYSGSTYQKQSDEKTLAHSLAKTSSNYLAKKLINLIFK